MISKNRFYVFLVDYFKGHVFQILLLLFLIFGGVALTSLSPYFYGKIVDNAAVGNIKSLTIYIFMYFILTAVGYCLGLIESYAGQRLTYLITNNIRKDLFAKILRMKCKALDKYDIGELISRLNSDADIIVSFYFNVVTSILTIIFNFCISAYMVLSISRSLSIATFVFIPLSVMNNLFFRKKFKKLSEQQRKFGDEYSTFSVRAFSNILGLRSFRQETKIEEQFDEFIKKQWKLTQKGIKLGNLSGSFSTCISMLLTITTILLAAYQIMNNCFTIGNLVSFQSYLDRLFGSVSSLLSLNLESQNVIVSMDRLEQLHNEPDERNEYSSTIGSDLGFYSLKFENVTFRYTQSQQLVLNSINFDINGPGLYSFVGENGSGKSSILKLIMKYYDCDSGNISVDGVRYNDIGIAMLRQKIVYIPKETYLVDESIENNVKILIPDASLELVKNACKEAGLEEFINTLAEKYNTKIGENGKFLSSGQRQKIGIARAILCDSNVLLLDEITSDLDGKSETDIINSIKQISKKKIVLLVTHRLKSLISSKTIFVINKGCIEDKGTHTQLIKSSKVYRDMFTQTNSF